MKFRQFLLRLRIWKLYRRAVKQVRQQKVRLAEQQRKHEAELRAVRTFYEKRVDTERIRRTVREDALVDRVLQATRLMGIQNLSWDADKRATAPPYHESPPTVDGEIEYDLTPDQADYIADYKEGLREMALEAGISDAEFELQWKTEYEAEAIKEASDRLEM